MGSRKGILYYLGFEERCLSFKWPTGMRTMPVRFERPLSLEFVLADPEKVFVLWQVSILQRP